MMQYVNNLNVKRGHLIKSMKYVCIFAILSFSLYREIKGEVIEQVQLGLKLRRVIQERLKEALPDVRLTRERLMEEPENARLVYTLIATEVLEHLKPSERCAQDFKVGEELFT